MRASDLLSSPYNGGGSAGEEMRREEEEEEEEEEIDERFRKVSRGGVVKRIGSDGSITSHASSGGVSGVGVGLVLGGGVGGVGGAGAGVGLGGGGVGGVGGVGVGGGDGGGGGGGGDGRALGSIDRTFSPIGIKHDGGYTNGGGITYSITDGTKRGGSSHVEPGRLENSGVSEGEKATNDAAEGDESDDVGVDCGEVVEVWRTNRGPRTLRPVRMR
eukprot:jgi/Undpi1/5064/HiC_scaffold_19.g08416.m1